MPGRRLIDRINSAALLLLGSVAFVTAGPAIDQHFPVVKPFVVTQTSVGRDLVQIEGWMEKRRECRFVEVIGVAHRQGRMDVVVSIEFLDAPKLAKSRPAGVQSWGPWRMVAPLGTQNVDLIAYHRCHPLWETKTRLATIEVRS